jgi:hypothetical protein
MKSAVLVFPGINRERDMARALKLASGQEAAMVWHAETALPKGTDLVVVPGGFSYGDICAAAPLPRARRHDAGASLPDGGLALGVCNGRSRVLRSGGSYANAAEIHLQGCPSAGRTLGYAVHARGNAASSLRAGRAWRGQLRATKRR